MSEFSDRVKDQLEQLNTSVDQVINASRGLYVKIREESNKQFEELVKAGEEQAAAEESFLEQLKQDITTPFDDMKSTVGQIRHAYMGLVVKAYNSGEQMFDELVELGTSKVEKVEKAATKKVKAVEKKIAETAE